MNASVKAATASILDEETILDRKRRQASRQSRSTGNKRNVYPRKQLAMKEKRT
jgi:hypothetical protein